MAIDVRYVGTRLVNGWTTENWNEINVFENGFLDEFKLAQANLRAHVAAGPRQLVRLSRPRHRHVAPADLPRLLQRPARGAGECVRYTSTQFTNSAWTGHLGSIEPDPVDAGNDLHANATFRANALARRPAGELLRAEPRRRPGQHHATTAARRYDALQIDFRRRLSRGLPVTAQLHLRQDLENRPQTCAATARICRPADDGVPHAFKTNWNYEVPVGRGRRFGSEHQPVAERASSATGSSRARAGSRCDFRIDGRRARRHDRGRAEEGVQGPDSENRRPASTSC